MKRILSVVLSAVILSAACAVGVCAAPLLPFSDVEPGRWSAEAISYAADKGYMVGTGDGLFSPEQTLTRAEAVTVVWRRHGSPAPTYPSAFSDVEPGAWYADACAWAAENGIVYGKGDGIFDPSGGVTREQLAAIF